MKGGTVSFACGREAERSDGEKQALPGQLASVTSVNGKLWSLALVKRRYLEVEMAGCPVGEDTLVGSQWRCLRYTT